MQECPGSPQGVVNKALSFETQTKDYYNNSLPIPPCCAASVSVRVSVWALCVGVCMHATQCPGEGFVYEEGTDW